MVLLVTLTLPAIAQESTVKGNLSGTVYDSTGAVVPGAKITLTGALGAKTTDSDNEGHFIFPLLIPGFYTVRVEKQSFKASEVKGVEIATDRTSAIRVTLEPGAVSEVVEVTTSVVTVDTSTTMIGANLTDSFYSQIPMSRNVAGLFYVAPGVVSSGANPVRNNPSISGGSGLENQYIADGVSMNDGAFGAIGVYARGYGSLSTGINLSFVQEVQVKSGGYEPQYGKSTGGIVQIVTKSGGNTYHGLVAGYFAPQQLEAEQLQPDLGGTDPSQQRFNQNGQLRHQGNFDVDGELGGYVPGFGKDKLFFFGSFDPSWTRDYGIFAPFHNVPYYLGGPSGGLGPMTAKATSYNYAAKLTWKINNSQTLEGSVFGDPTRTPMQNGPPGQATFRLISPSAFNKMSYGTRNVVVRYNGTLSPTWLVNASWSWGHNYLTNTAADPTIYGVSNLVGCLASAVDGGVLAPNDAPVAAACTFTGAFGASGSPFLSFGSVVANPVNCPSQAPCLNTGSYGMQGYGYSENTEGDNYGFEIDTQKSFNFLGNHTFSIGYKLDRNFYDGNHAYTGGLVPLPMTNWNGTATPAGLWGAGLPQAMTSAGMTSFFQLLVTPNTRAPLYPMPDGSTPHVRLYQYAGEYGPMKFYTAGTYHAIYGMDSWSPWKYLTINAGIRWEQQYMQGSYNQDAGATPHYTWVGNWSPRIGVIVDPWGDRKTKVYVNFGRYNYAIPLDMAIRSMGYELDVWNGSYEPHWVGEGPGSPLADPASATGAICQLNCPAFIQLNPDGTIPNPTVDAAHLLSGNHGLGVSLASTQAIAPSTKMESLDEWVVGFERDFGHGIIFSGRYIDRRMKWIVEDMSGISPEAANVGVIQNFLISNPNPNTDLFINPKEIVFTPTYNTPGDPSSGVNPASVPAACWGFDPTVGVPVGPPATAQPIYFGQVVNTYNQPIQSPSGLPADALGTNSGVCVLPMFNNLGVANYPGGHEPGDVASDGIPEGFVQPVRNYQAIELEVNKSFSRNWQLRSNYRLARLKGNYEGAFRNDNSQSDPSISSLFDFTSGIFNQLGDQFAIGYLNTDRRHVVNIYFSYLFDKYFLKGLTIGTGLRVQTGPPINDLKAHPVYGNGGEVPVNGRGSLGRFPTTGQVDLNLDYAFKATEKSRVHLAAALFNIANMQRVTNIDQYEDRRFGVPNVDFKRPAGNYIGFQHPFYARLSVKWEF